MLVNSGKRAWTKVAAVAMIVAFAAIMCAATTTHAEARVISGKTSSGLVYTRYTALGEASIFGYKGKSSKVTIPATIKGAKVTYVSIYYANLTSVNVSYAKYLTNLTLNGNRLSSLNVSRNTNLQSLYVSGNRLSSLNISNNSKLKYLACSQNNLKTLNISRNNKLKYLSIWGNPLTSSAKASLKRWGAKSGHSLSI